MAAAGPIGAIAGIMGIKRGIDAQNNHAQDAQNDLAAQQQQQNDLVNDQKQKAANQQQAALTLPGRNIGRSTTLFSGYAGSPTTGTARTLLGV